jgi:hypothetical protein
MLGDPTVAAYPTLAAMISRSRILPSLRAILTTGSGELQSAAYSFVRSAVETNDAAVLQGLLDEGVVAAIMSRLTENRTRRSRAHASLKSGACSHCVNAMHESVHKKKSQLAQALNSSSSSNTGDRLLSGSFGGSSLMDFPFMTELNESSNSSGSVGLNAVGSGGAPRGAGRKGGSKQPAVCQTLVQHVLTNYRHLLDGPLLAKFERAAHETPQEADEDVQSSEAASRANSKAALISDSDFTALLKEFGPDAPGADDAVVTVEDLQHGAQGHLTSLSEAVSVSDGTGHAAGSSDFTLVRSHSIRKRSSGASPLGNACDDAFDSPADDEVVRSPMRGIAADDDPSSPLPKAAEGSAEPHSEKDGPPSTAPTLADEEVQPARKKSRAQS